MPVLLEFGGENNLCNIMFLGKYVGNKNLHLQRKVKFKSVESGRVGHTEVSKPWRQMLSGQMKLKGPLE